MPQEDHAKALGTQQVLYTLPCGPDPDQATISEAGAMNVFVLFAHPNGGCASGRPLVLLVALLPNVIVLAHWFVNYVRHQCSSGEWDMHDAGRQSWPHLPWTTPFCLA